MLRNKNFGASLMLPNLMSSLVVKRGLSPTLAIVNIEWETEQLTTNQYTYSISYSFLDTLATTGLQQIVNFPTRNNNTLDVVLTNRPSLVKQCVGMPGLSDHDIVFVETSSRALRHKPARRKILLWKHANFDDIRLKISNWTRDFISSNTTFTPVESLATIITDSLSKIALDSVPSKFSTRRLEQCWTTTLTKRMCRRKARAFRKARQTKKSRDWERYLILKRATQKTCREAYNNYLIKTLTSDPNGNKRLGALIKSKQHDHLGVAPLKEGSIIYCDPIQRQTFSTVNSSLSLHMTQRHQSQTLDLVNIQVWKI